MTKKDGSNDTMLELLTHGLSGAASGCIALIVWYPLETLRIRIQEKYKCFNLKRFGIERENYKCDQ